LNSKGARAHRKEFIETSYINGVVNDFGDQVIRPLNKDEISWLDKFYKEFIHSTFVTDSESILLFKKAKALTKKKENVVFFNKNGFFPEHVQQSIDAFNKKYPLLDENKKPLETYVQALKRTCDFIASVEETEGVE
jgi:hypothetical protein